MDYKRKFKKYELKYNNLKAGMIPSKDSKLWCINDDIKITSVNVIEMKTQNIIFKDTEINILIPKKLKATIIFKLEGVDYTYINDYEFDGFISRGGYGSVFKYNKIGDKIGLKGIACKVILSNDTVRDVETRILPELNIVNKYKNSDCRKIDSYSLNLDTILPRAPEKYNIYKLGETKYVSMTIMPLADGEVYDGLQKHNLLTLNNKIDLFNYCVNVLKCMLINHDLVYPDLKTEQLLYFKCDLPDGSIKYVYILGDLGGFQEFEESPICSYGPNPRIIKRYNLNSLNVALYPVAALWADLFSNNENFEKLGLLWKINQMFISDFSTIKELSKSNVGSVPNANSQRDLVIEILSKDPRNFETKEQILEYLEMLFI